MYTIMFLLNVVCPIVIVVLLIKVHDMKRDIDDLRKEIETLKKSGQ